MRSLLCASLVATALLVQAMAAEERAKKERAELTALAEQVFKLAKPKDEMGFAPGIDREAQKLTERFAAHDHRKVVEVLLPLLQHEQDGVAHLAGFIIRMCDDGVVPEQLEALKKGYQKGAAWLPYAIASVQSDQAIEFLADEFRKNPQTGGQVDAALASLGEKAAPVLLAGFERAEMKEEAYFHGLEEIFRGMYGKGKTVVPRLLEMAESEKLEAERRRCAVQLLIAADRPSDEVLSRLKTLATREPHFFAEVVESAILAGGTPEAAVILADYVDKGNTHCIRNIAHLGANGRTVGPRVARWLDNEDWEVRVDVAYTLGAIGYTGGRQTLEKLLPAYHDWRLACATSQALVSLDSKESIPVLSTTARSHWHPLARKKAAEGVEILEGKRNDGDIKEYLEPVVSSSVQATSFPPEKLVGVLPRTEVVGSRESFEDFEKHHPEQARKFLKLRTWNGEGKLKYFGSMLSYPVKGGVFLGGEAGEWVGGFAFLPDKGEGAMLLKANVCNMEKWKGKLLVAEGICHLIMNTGMVHEIRMDGHKAKTVPWFVLPSCPTSMWVSSKDQLVVKCLGGTVVFTDPETIEFYSAPKE